MVAHAFGSGESVTRDAAQNRRSDPSGLRQGAGGDAEDFLAAAVEVALVEEATVCSHLGDRLTSDQPFLGLVDADLQQIGVGRQADSAAESETQPSGGDPSQGPP